MRCRSPPAVHPGPSASSRIGPCSTLLRARFTQRIRSPGGGRGGLLSVALALGSPRVGVTHRPALRSPDVPRRPPPKRWPTRPSAGPFLRSSLRGGGSGLVGGADEVLRADARTV